MAVLVGSSGRGAGMLVARVDSVCMQHGQSKQFAHLEYRQMVGYYNDEKEFALSVALVRICFAVSTSPVLFQLSLCRRHVFQAAWTVVRVHLFAGIQD